MFFLLLASTSLGKDCHRPCHRSLDHLPMDDPIVVSSNVEPTHPTPSADCSTQGSTSHSASTPHGPPTLQETLPPGSSFVGEALSGFGLPPTTATLIKESWRPGTRVQYDSLLRGWTRFCSSRQVHPMSPTIYDILAYLTSMFERGLAYRTISAAKSVLSGIIHVPGVTAISEHPLVIRLLKGIFHVRPPQPRYELIWDTDLVLSYLKNLSSSTYSLKFLSLKLVTLLTLLSGQRVSTVHQFRISHMQSDTFTAHSCRSASTSKAMSSGVALDVILKAGQWSADSTFYQFYRKDIVKIWEPCGNYVCRKFDKHYNYLILL